MLSPCLNWYLSSIWYRWSLLPTWFMLISRVPGRIRLLVSPTPLHWSVPTYSPLLAQDSYCWSALRLGLDHFSCLFAFTSWWLHSSFLVFGLHANVVSRFVYSIVNVTSLFRWLMETETQLAKLSTWVFPNPAFTAFSISFSGNFILWLLRPNTL